MIQADNRRAFGGRRVGRGEEWQRVYFAFCGGGCSEDGWSQVEVRLPARWRLALPRSASRFVCACLNREADPHNVKTKAPTPPSPERQYSLSRIRVWHVIQRVGDPHCCVRIHFLRHRSRRCGFGLGNPHLPRMLGRRLFVRRLPEFSALKLSLSLSLS